MAKKKVVKVKKKPVANKKTTKVTKAKTKGRKLAKKAVVSRKKKVSALPKGYQSITPYLIVDRAAIAIDFYKKVFDAKEVMRMEGKDGKIRHAELKINNEKIMLADEYPSCGARSPHSIGGSPVSIHLYVKNVDSVVDTAVSSGAKLLMPVDNMFYGDRSGLLEDPFGHKWQVSTHVEDVSKAKLKKRAAELFG